MNAQCANDSTKCEDQYVFRFLKLRQPELWTNFHGREPSSPESAPNLGLLY